MRNSLLAFLLVFTLQQKIGIAFGKHAPEAIKVMQCESGGVSKCNDGLNSNGSVDCGLFQINSIHEYSRAELLNETKNIVIARSMFMRQGWKPWYSSRSCHGLR